MNKCTDCEYSKERYEILECRRIDARTGKPIGVPCNCDTQRTGGFIFARVMGLCGKKGRFFSAK